MKTKLTLLGALFSAMSVLSAQTLQESIEKLRLNALAIEDVVNGPATGAGSVVTLPNGGTQDTIAKAVANLTNADNKLDFTTAQTLTAAQKTQALSNLGVSSSAGSPSLMPLTRFIQDIDWHTSNGSTAFQKPLLHFGLLGDSITTITRKMGEQWQKQIGLAGFGYGSLDAKLNGSATVTVDHDKSSQGNVYTIPSGASVEFGAQDNGQSSTGTDWVPSDTVKIPYVKTATGGTFIVEVLAGRDGSFTQNGAAVSTSHASETFDIEERTIPRGYNKIRISCTSGSVQLVATPALWDSKAAGLIIHQFGRGGTDITKLTDVPEADFAQMVSSVSFTAWSYISADTRVEIEPVLPGLVARVNAANLGKDGTLQEPAWIMGGCNPINPTVVSSVGVTEAYEYLREYAVANDYFFLATRDVMPTYQQGVDAGIMVDDYHPYGDGTELLGAQLTDRLRLDLIWLKNRSARKDNVTTPFSPYRGWRYEMSSNAANRDLVLPIETPKEHNVVFQRYSPSNPLVSRLTLFGTENNHVENVNGLGFSRNNAYKLIAGSRGVSVGSNLGSDIARTTNYQGTHGLNVYASNQYAGGLLIDINHDNDTIHNNNNRSIWIKKNGVTWFELNNKEEWTLKLQPSDVYADQAAVNAANLPSGRIYQISGDDTLRRKQ